MLPTMLLANDLQTCPLWDQPCGEGTPAGGHASLNGQAWADLENMGSGTGLLSSHPTRLWNR